LTGTKHKERKKGRRRSERTNRIVGGIKIQVLLYFHSKKSSDTYQPADGSSQGKGRSLEREERGE
jgi:hypothetical protein